MTQDELVEKIIHFLNRQDDVDLAAQLGAEDPGTIGVDTADGDTYFVVVQEP